VRSLLVKDFRNWGAYTFVISISKTNFLEYYKKISDVGSYTQERTAGDFLSSRKAARAERYPPKTTAAGLDG
jgi:hypothetical protein